MSLQEWIAKKLGRGTAEQNQMEERRADYMRQLQQQQAVWSHKIIDQYKQSILEGFAARQTPPAQRKFDTLTRSVALQELSDLAVEFPDKFLADILARVHWQLHPPPPFTALDAPLKRKPDDNDLVEAIRRVALQYRVEVTSGGCSDHGDTIGFRAAILPGGST